MTGRRIIVVSYFHPPYPSAGGNRWVAMARHLRAAGHSVTIVASNAFGASPDDAVGHVVRARDLKSWDFARRLLRRGPMPRAGTGASVERPSSRLLTGVVVPDTHVVSWLPSVVYVVRRLARKGNVDCLVTTGPPESAHLVGLVRPAGPRAAWIADFRDGWTFEPLREPFPTRPQRALDATLERNVVERADEVVAATEPIAIDLAARFGVPAVTIPNGYDPMLDVEASEAPLPRLPEGRTLVVHTGALSGLRGRDPRPLLDALARLAEDEDVGSRIVFVQAGPTSPSDHVALAELGERGVVSTLGLVPRSTAIALQRRADALILLTSAHRSQTTGKLYEYLAAGRPIVAIGDDNEAARLVRETQTGVTVPLSDVDAIAAALRRVVDGKLAYAPRGVDRFVHPAPALEMAEAIERAVSRRSRARRLRTRG